MSRVSDAIVSAEKRDESMRIKDIRKKGFIPAIIYARGSEAIAIQVEYQAFRKAFRVSGTCTVLDIEFEGKKIPTLVHNMQWHPVSGEYQHIDFYELQEETPVKTTIEVLIEGLCPAVKTKAAILSTPVTQIDIQCLPRDLFHNVTINVSELKDYHQTVKVSDLPLAQDKKVQILTSGEVILVAVNTPKGGIKKEVPVVATKAKAKAKAKK